MRNGGAKAKTEEEESPGISYEALLALVRSAAPFAGLSQGSVRWRAGYAGGAVSVG